MKYCWTSRRKFGQNFVLLVVQLDIADSQGSRHLVRDHLRSSKCLPISVLLCLPCATVLHLRGSGTFMRVTEIIESQNS